MAYLIDQPLPCVRCTSAEVRRLDYVSQDAWVDYYRCSSCGHVWNVPKVRPRADDRPAPADTVH